MRRRASVVALPFVVLTLGWYLGAATLAAADGPMALRLARNWFDGLSEPDPAVAPPVTRPVEVAQPKSRVEVPDDGSLSIDEIDRRILITTYQLSQMQSTPVPGISRSFYVTRRDLSSRLQRLRELRRTATARTDSL